MNFMRSISPKPETRDALQKFGLDAILSPVGFDAFVQNFHDNRPLFLSRSQPDHYSGLVSLTEMDEFLARAKPGYATVFAIDARRNIATEEFAGAEGLSDPLRLAQLFEAGATIVYRDIQDHFPALKKLCRTAETRFHAPFAANIYLAPPQGRSFPIHFDACDVFALQISGSKRWRLYRPQLERPSRDQHCYADMADDGALGEFALHAGDMLYVPRGFPHLVEAMEEPSLHVSLSSFPHTWADVLSRALTEVCAGDPAFRAALPPGFARGAATAAECEKQFSALIARFAAEAQLASGLRPLIRQFVAERATRVDDPRGRLSAARALSLESRLEPDPDALFLIENEPDAVVLLGRGQEIRFTPQAFTALSFALKGEGFQIRAAPGELEDEAKLDLFRTLLIYGFVSLVEDGEG